MGPQGSHSGADGREMKIFIVFVHVALGLIVIFIDLNSQAVSYSKIHRTERYYSSEDLSNSAIRDHIEDLRRSEQQHIVEGVLAIILAVFSIIGAIALKRDRPWAAFALPFITLLLVMAVFYTGRFATGFEAAAYAIPVYVLLMFFGLEVLYVLLRKRELFSRKGDQ